MHSASSLYHKSAIVLALSHNEQSYRMQPARDAPRETTHRRPKPDGSPALRPARTVHHHVRTLNLSRRAEVVLKVSPRRLEGQVPHVQLATGHVRPPSATAAVRLPPPSPAPTPPLALRGLFSVFAHEDRTATEGGVVELSDGAVGAASILVLHDAAPLLREMHACVCVCVAEKRFFVVRTYNYGGGWLVGWARVICIPPPCQKLHSVGVYDVI